MKTLFGDSLRPTSYWIVCSALVVGNLALFLKVNGFSSLVEDFSVTPTKALLPFLVLVGTCIFPRRVRDSIAHFRIRHPLPGCEAFTRWAKIDPRISLEKLKAKIGNFPKMATKQNTAWYEVYQKVKREPEIVAVHKKYLLFRDFAILQADALMIWAAASFVFLPLPWPGWILLVFAYLAFVICAKNTGVHFVQTVLAISQ